MNSAVKDSDVPLTNMEIYNLTGDIDYSLECMCAKYRQICMRVCYVMLVKKVTDKTYI